jgi:hypothetical protein
LKWKGRHPFGQASYFESWLGKRFVELEAKTRVSSTDIATTLTGILGKPACTRVPIALLTGNRLLER